MIAVGALAKLFHDIAAAVSLMVTSGRHAPAPLKLTDKDKRAR
jgi:hypothetical protein